MRELKFRGWHHGGGDPRIAGRMTYSHPFPAIFWENVENEPLAVEVMQFTGLHDKNGKEIFEGDVIKWEHSEHLLLVKWHIAGWALFSKLFSRFGLPHGSECTANQAAQYARNSEVIGNLHENPELLVTK